MKKCFCIVLGVCLLWGCERDEVANEPGVAARLRVAMPEEAVAEGVKVEWTNRVTGVVYGGVTDAQGRMECRVEAGIYRVTAQRRSVAEHENSEELYSGGLEEVVAGGSGVDTVLRLAYARMSRLVVKEIYYVGCRTDAGGQYSLDNYLTLYNNSADTLWLDGVCVGRVGPVKTMVPSNWLAANPELPEIPVISAGWQFPGRGHDHPLAPGGETTIAVNAVDHRVEVSRSVDLSGADWVFFRNDFNPEFSMNPHGITCLDLFWLNWPQQDIPPMYSIGPGAPGIMIFRMEGNAGAFAEANLKYEPTKPEIPNNQYLMIPREWVMDYVECVNEQRYAVNKRVPVVLDKSAVYVSGGSGSATALRRKVAGDVDGRVIYQDTNDSANDFVETKPEP